MASFGVYQKEEIETGKIEEVGKMTRKWEVRNGKVLVVEDAATASLVIVAKDLKDQADKVAAVKEVLSKLEA